MEAHSSCVDFGLYQHADFMSSSLTNSSFDIIEKFSITALAVISWYIWNHPLFFWPPYLRVFAEWGLLFKQYNMVQITSLWQKRGKVDPKKLKFSSFIFLFFIFFAFFPFIPFFISLRMVDHYAFEVLILTPGRGEMVAIDPSLLAHIVACKLTWVVP